jgi:hypothetical protein
MRLVPSRQKVSTVGPQAFEVGLDPIPDDVNPLSVVGLEKPRLNAEGLGEVSGFSGQ